MVGICAGVVLWIVSCLLGGMPQAVAAEKDDGADHGYVQVMLNGWLSGINGDVEIGTEAVGVSADFGDILEHADGAIAGRLEAGWRKLGVMVDGTYISTSASITSIGSTFPQVSISRGAGVDLGVVDFGLYYLLFGERPLMKKGWAFGFEPFLGGRYVLFDQQFFFAGPLHSHSLSQDTHWVDPLLGVRVSGDLIGNLIVQAEGQIGGFGAGTDLTWTASGTVGYGFFQVLVVSAGYKAIGIDYDNDQTGGGYRGLDAVLHGPLMALGVHF